MTIDSVLRASVGGILVGLAAALVLLLHGRIAGISGTLGRALDRDDGAVFRRAFLIGLVVTGIAIARLAPSAIGAPIATTPMLAIAGLLVGIGTTLSNGCTSGHGVCGISRGSFRSLVAVGTFMVSGAIAVAIVGALR